MSLQLTWATVKSCLEIIYICNFVFNPAAVLCEFLPSSSDCKYYLFQVKNILYHAVKEMVRALKMHEDEVEDMEDT